MVDNHVVCVKWGNKYISKYANVLNNMAKRHTTVPYTFHCLTDDPTGLDPDINVIKLPNDPCIKSWWSKLWMFSPEMPLKGNILYFDLDVVIFDNIDPLFSYNTGKFNIIRDFNRCRVKDWKQSNSSCMGWKAGTMDHLYNNFVKNHQRIMQQNWGDQDWIMKAGKEQITHWPDEWIRSYKWEMRDRSHLDRIGGIRNFKVKAEPLVHNLCNVAVFHGEPHPHQVEDDWVKENWR